jgi:type I restriction enzyme S subunit
LESTVCGNGKYPVYGANGICGYKDSYDIEEGAILIIKDGASVGSSSLASGKYSVIGTLNYLTAKDGYSLEYLYYCLKSFNFSPYITGMAIPHIYFRDYSKAMIWIPSMGMQQRIATTLHHIQQKVDTEKKVLDLYSQQKQHFLQKMFI